MCAKFNVETVQNVEQSKKIPCEKPLMEQLEIMELYTDTHRRHLGDSRERREVECLKVLYPRLFRSIQDWDLFAGRLDYQTLMDLGIPGLRERLTHT